jgi:hypothetical protein
MARQLPRGEEASCALPFCWKPSAIYIRYNILYIAYKV